MEEVIYRQGFPYTAYHRNSFDAEEMIARSKQFFNWMDERRTVRDFSDKPIPREVIENIIKTASTAPSGAHKQPWTFCVVADAAVKKQIREAAEAEEKESYEHRMTAEWLKDLAPLGTDWQKPFLEIAPYLIIVFKKPYDYDENKLKKNNYYVTESVGLACGMLLAAIHHAGLVALTHTPSPMNFLVQLLNRPDNERPFLLIPVGYAANQVYVPQLSRKQLNEVAVWY
jgi:nitroreductase